MRGGDVVSVFELAEDGFIGFTASMNFLERCGCGALNYWQKNFYFLYFLGVVTA